MTTNIEPLILPATPGAAATCDLTDAADTPEERLAEYGRLFAHALIGRQRTPDGTTFTFAAKAGVAEWVANLARREAACCPFLAHEVRRDGDRVMWRFSMPGGRAATAVLDEVHDLPDRCSEGFAALAQRLRGRGVTLVSVAPHRFTIEDDDPVRE